MLFYKFLYFNVFTNSIDHFQVSLKSDESYRYHTWKPTGVDVTDLCNGDIMSFLWGTSQGQRNRWCSRSNEGSVLCRVLAETEDTDGYR